MTDAVSNDRLVMGVDQGPAGETVLRLSGQMDAQSLAATWPQALELLVQASPTALVIDASAVTYCDGAGVALLVDLQRRGERKGFTTRIDGLRKEYQQLLALFRPGDFPLGPREKPATSHLPEQLGRAARDLAGDLHAQTAFLGELLVSFGHTLRHPRRLRWRDALLTAENVGANAVPIVALISFLVGLIMAFQAAIPMGEFGADIYVADLVALVILRELGPLMTAILLAGRSGSAFAAELGTMKVNEELDALTTMGLDPVGFLVVPRVLATLVMMPLLTLFANLTGLVGGAVVFVLRGYPWVTYYNQVINIIDLSDFLGGMLKAFVFGILVAAIGCLRGLQTESGALAIGQSTTRAVVSGIILVILADAVFSVIYYSLGI